MEIIFTKSRLAQLLGHLVYTMMILYVRNGAFLKLPKFGLGDFGIIPGLVGLKGVLQVVRKHMHVSHSRLDVAVLERCV